MNQIPTEEEIPVPLLTKKIPGMTSKEAALDMIRALRTYVYECNNVTPASIRDSTFHLERALFRKEITEDDHSLLFNDLITLSAEFSDKCICTKVRKKYK